MNSEKENLRIVIVGGVAGGASAAARARRHSESAEIILIERGSDVSFANCGRSPSTARRKPSPSAKSMTAPRKSFPTTS